VLESRKRFDRVADATAASQPHTINDERVRMNLTRRTFLGLAGALVAASSAVIDDGPRRPVAPSTDDPAPTAAARRAKDYSAIVGVL
jgi:hypothetical protein